jgi:plasmid stabilization system protein ParE
MSTVLYEIHPEAQAEYENHLRFYAVRGFNLTTLEEFRAEIEDAFDKISASPLAYRLARKGSIVRRFGATKRFHFVIYFLKDDRLMPYILAVAHPSRRPNYWIHRT